MTMTAKKQARMIKAHTEIQKRLHEISSAWTFYEFEAVDAAQRGRTICVCIAALNNEATSFVRGLAVRHPDDATNPLIGQVFAGRRALRAYKHSTIVTNEANYLERGHIVVALRKHGIETAFLTSPSTGKTRWVSGQIIEAWTKEEEELLTRNT